MVKICPNCGKKMIKRYEDYILLTNSPQYPWYCFCGYGHIERGEIDEVRNIEQIYREKEQVKEAMRNE